MEQFSQDCPHFRHQHKCSGSQSDSHFGYLGSKFKKYKNKTHKSPRQKAQNLRPGLYKEKYDNARDRKLNHENRNIITFFEEKTKISLDFMINSVNLQT